ncbi:MAG TPA: hypothetical protein EYP57_08815 [Thermodesulfobacteriaceae bacterium]|nr:hypothetical protein [Thermodesulfobacteriaceae bacterium]
MAFLDKSHLVDHSIDGHMTQLEIVPPADRPSQGNASAVVAPGGQEFCSTKRRLAAQEVVLN